MIKKISLCERATVIEMILLYVISCQFISQPSPKLYSETRGVFHEAKSYFCSPKGEKIRTNSGRESASKVNLTKGENRNS